MPLLGRFDGRYLRLIGQAIALFQEFSDIDEPANTPAGLKARIAVALKAAKLIAEQTPSQNDDNLVASVETLLNNDQLIEFLATLLGKFQGQDIQSLIASIEADEQGQGFIEELKAKGINWGELFTQLLPLIQMLLEMFNSKGATKPTTDNSGSGFSFDE
jgi:hypothetical protein